MLQRLGRRDEATTAFKRFETLNQEKIGFPLAHTYGDEGHYSLVQDALTLNPQVGPMIPVTFTRADHRPHGRCRLLSQAIGPRAEHA